MQGGQQVGAAGKARRHHRASVRGQKERMDEGGSRVGHPNIASKRPTRGNFLLGLWSPRIGFSHNMDMGEGGTRARVCQPFPLRTCPPPVCLNPPPLGMPEPPADMLEPPAGMLEPPA
eukprot:scaffold11837_cov101-Isochrysis_galbana.AAC.1